MCYVCPLIARGKIDYIRQKSYQTSQSAIKYHIRFSEGEGRLNKLHKNQQIIIRRITFQTQTMWNSKMMNLLGREECSSDSRFSVY